MNVYVCTDQDGFNPVGVASVVVARSEKEARELLDKALRAKGLRVTDYTFVQLSKAAQAIILNAGDY